MEQESWFALINVLFGFGLRRCGPCQRIAPIFEQLSLKYPKAVFLKVDVDKCADTASMQDVSAMPTFIFYRRRTRLGHCQGADPVGLESKIQQFYGSGDVDDADDSVADSLPGHVRNTENAYYHIFGMILLAVVLFYWNKYQ